MLEKTALNKFFALPLSEQIALISANAFLFSAWQFNLIANIALYFLIATCVLNKDFWRYIQRSPIVWSVGLFVSYLWLRTIFAIIEHPEYAQFQHKDATRLLFLAGFIFVGWALKGGQPRVFPALLIALLGFTVGRLKKFPWQLLFDGSPWWESRMELGLPSAIAFGQYAAAGTLGLMILAPRIFSAPRRGTLRVVTFIAWSFFFTISVQGVVLSQARGVWLSVAVIAILLLALPVLRYERLDWKRYSSILAVTLMVFLSVGYLNHKTVLQRLSTEAETVGHLVAGNMDEIQPYDEKGNVRSMGIRFHMILFGIEHWKKNPVFGLGPGITKPLIRDQWPYAKIHLYNDLHNGYIEMLLRLGLLGSALIILILALLIREGWRAYREGRMDGDLLLLLYAAIALHLLINATNFRMLNYDWRYYWFLFGGALLSFDRSFTAPPMSRKYRSIQQLQR